MTWYTDPLLKNCRHIIIEDIQKEMMIGAYEHEKSSTQIINLLVWSGLCGWINRLKIALGETY